MSKRVIRVELTEAGIDRALAELEKFKKDFLAKCDELIEYLAKQGAVTAKGNVTMMVGHLTGATSTGRLAESIYWKFDKESRTGIIATDLYYAVFVEYGTGIVGEANPHPEPTWSYDVNGHGTDGWNYIGEDGKLHWTMGQISHPFMYNTYTELMRTAPDIAKRFFGDL